MTNDEQRPLEPLTDLRPIYDTIERLLKGEEVFVEPQTFYTLLILLKDCLWLRDQIAAGMSNTTATTQTSDREGISMQFDKRSTDEKPLSSVELDEKLEEEEPRLTQRLIAFAKEEGLEHHWERDPCSDSVFFRVTIPAERFLKDK